MFFYHADDVGKGHFSQFTWTIRFRQFLAILFIKDGYIRIQGFIALALLLEYEKAKAVECTNLHSLCRTAYERLNAVFHLVCRLIRKGHAQDILRLRIAALDEVSHSISKCIRFSCPSGR